MEVSPSAGAVAHLPNHKLKLNLQSLAVQQLVDEGCDVLDADGIVTVNVGKWGHLIVAQQDVNQACSITDGEKTVTIEVAGLGLFDSCARHVHGNRAAAPDVREGNCRLVGAESQGTIDDLDITGLGDGTAPGDHHAEAIITTDRVEVTHAFTGRNLAYRVITSCRGPHYGRVGVVGNLGVRDVDGAADR